MESITLKFKIPEKLCLSKTRFGNFGLFAKQNFKKGDIVFENQCPLVDFNSIPHKIIFDTNQGTFEGNKFTHTSHFFDNWVFMYNYDVYTNHSCDPNTSDYVIDKNDPSRYRSVAIKDNYLGCIETIG